FEASSEIKDVLSALAGPMMAIYTHSRRIGRRPAKFVITDPDTQITTESPVSEASALLEWLGARAFIKVALTYHQRFIAYVCLGSSKPRQFVMDDAAFLLQAANQIAPILEHIRLVDRMASDAADEERRRIARSIHDGVIQPYTGLQMGLKAVQNLVQSLISGNCRLPPQQQCERVTAALDNLMKMTCDGIEELRNYLYGLQPAEQRGEMLVNSLRRYAEKFEAATGISVTVVDRTGSLKINDRLAAEIFQMLT